MIIFFGTHSIRIKTYTYKELGLDEKYNGLKFQLYQNFFFIFFIPVFPITKFWKVKNSLTNKEVGTDAELRTQLNLVTARKKTPYWAYTGFFILITPVLFLVGLLLLNLTQEITRSAEKGIESIERRKENDKLNEETIDLIKNPEVGDLYHIKMIEMIPKKDVNGKRKGFKKGEREELEYELTQFSIDSLTLKLTKIPNYFAADLTLKNDVKVSGKDLITIADSFKTLYLYETIDGSEAVFAIQKIDRTDQ
ncbi:hypothetical protein [Aquimarina algiphila]|uniref:hypothetical protein n=1 Tax=Aquimarina algiphila TaxID=2047982 RepID=UPI00249047D1|nr:hypothetical protein [Aquimarina algiphila]